MKDLIIAYRDGKLAELRIDGVLVDGATAVSFTHEAGETMPSLTVSMFARSKESLIPPDVDRKTFESVAKRFTEADAVVVLTPSQDIAKAVQANITKRLREEMKPGGNLHN